MRHPRKTSGSHDSGETKSEPPAQTDVSSETGARLEPRRVLIGGFTMIFAVLGYLGVRAAVETAGVSRNVELIALPALGVVGVVGFVVLIAGVVPSEERPGDDEW